MPTHFPNTHARPSAVSTDLSCRVEALPLREPLQIAGHCFTDVPVLWLHLRDGAHEGHGEAAGIYYMQDRPADMPATLEPLRQEIAGGLDRATLRQRLPAGGARNALDCALWEIEARRRGCAVWQLAGAPSPRPLRTTFTLGADDPDRMAVRARALADAEALKLKLTGEPDLDIERVRAVRQARPLAWLSVDANQGYTLASIEPLIPVLADCQVALLEQPFARGREQDMHAADFPVDTAPDESCLSLAELERVEGLFGMVNIKLDKCGGLTEGLLIAQQARRMGLKVMVGNMGGSSLAMAPAFVLAQVCDVVDLDGPTFLARDRSPSVRYPAGRIFSPGAVWGGHGF